MVKSLVELFLGGMLILKWAISLLYKLEKMSMELDSNYGIKLAKIHERWLEKNYTLDCYPASSTQGWFSYFTHVF